MTGYEYKNYAAQIAREIENISVASGDNQMLIKFIYEMIKCAKASNKDLEIPKLLVGDVEVKPTKIDKNLLKFINRLKESDDISLDISEFDVGTLLIIFNDKNEDFTDREIIQPRTADKLKNWLIGNAIMYKYNSTTKQTTYKLKNNRKIMLMNRSGRNI